MDYSQKIQQLLKSITGNPTELYTKYTQTNRRWHSRFEKIFKVKKELPTTSKQELFEYKQAMAFLDTMLNRIKLLKEFNEALKSKYLRIIEPLYSEAGVRNLLFHYFDIDEKIKAKGEILFVQKTQFQTEVNIIYDLYRSKKTAESITKILDVLLIQDKPFNSVLSLNERYEFLTTLFEILKLFFIKLIKASDRGTIYKVLGDDALAPKKLLNQRENKSSPIEESQLKNNAFRQQFFLVYFTTKMKSLVNKQYLEIDLNYFNYELIKKEYLIHWMKTKLKGNKQKKETLNKHRIGDEKVGDLVEENPDQESKILDSISAEKFNDIAEEISEKVGGDLKAPIATLSTKFGSFAKFHKTFVKAQSLAKMSLEKMKSSIAKTLSLEKKKPKVNLPKASQVAEKEVAIAPYHIDVLEPHQISFPFFTEQPETYDKNLEFFEKKTGELYNKIKADVWKLLSNVSSRHFNKRKEINFNEWAIPFYLRHKDNPKEEHLLILGAMIVKQDKDADLKASLTRKESTAIQLHEVRPYFVYATKEVEKTFGAVTKIRKVKAVNFSQYKFNIRTVIAQVIKITDWIVNQQESNIFESSHIEFKAPTGKK